MLCIGSTIQNEAAAETRGIECCNRIRRVQIVEDVLCGQAKPDAVATSGAGSAEAATAAAAATTTKTAAGAAATATAPAAAIATTAAGKLLAEAPGLSETEVEGEQVGAGARVDGRRSVTGAGSRLCKG